MLLITITVIVLVIIAIVVIATLYYRYTHHGIITDAHKVVGTVCGLCLGVLLTIMVVFTVLGGIADSESELYYIQEYNKIVYLSEKINSADVEAVDEIVKFNKDLIEKQHLTDNEFIGVFYPDYYKDYSLISLKHLGQPNINGYKAPNGMK